MPLPKLDLPTYEITLPLSKKRVKFRPFTVKEQRNLFIAMESDEAEIVQTSVTDILSSCNLTKNINIDELPIVDVEFYFINLRAKSVGEIVESRYRCNNIIDEEKNTVCNNIMETDVDLTKITAESKVNVSPEIKLTDKYILKLKYPQFSFVKNALKVNDENVLAFNIIAQSVEHIFDGEQYYYGHETPLEEMIEFIENLNQDQFTKIEEFFNNLPKIRQKIDLKCKKCGFEHHLNVEGLENFFG